MIDWDDDRYELICKMCGELTHTKPWIIEGINSWWLIDNHCISRLFDTEIQAVDYAKKHGLDVKRRTT